MKVIDSVEQARAEVAKISHCRVKGRDGREIAVPCMDTALVRRSLITANTYNPNHVSDDKMALLRESIEDNGFCFPVVAIWDDDLELFVVVDGFHRSVIGGAGWLEMEYLPLVILDHDISKRMVATHQFNKARGVHQVDLDAEIIRALVEQGMPEEKIAIKLGIDKDTVHRYKQLTGVAELFKNSDWSVAWEMVEDREVAP